MQTNEEKTPTAEDAAARACRGEAERSRTREERARNRWLDADTIAAALRDKAPDAVPYARKVGAWIWIEFPAIPEAATRETLKALGFSWNRNRGAWQHPGGVWKPQNRRIDPREVYGEEPIEQTA